MAEVQEYQVRQQSAGSGKSTPTTHLKPEAKPRSCALAARLAFAGEIPACFRLPSESSACPSMPFYLFIIFRTCRIRRVWTARKEREREKDPRTHPQASLRPCIPPVLFIFFWLVLDMMDVRRLSTGSSRTSCRRKSGGAQRLIRCD